MIIEHQLYTNITEGTEDATVNKTENVSVFRGLTF